MQHCWLYEEAAMTHPAVAIVYFTATDVTGSYARAIDHEIARLGARPQLVNITPWAARQAPLDFSPYDGVIFGFPVYGDLAPSVVNEWLPCLNGQRRPCATFFTYGGRTTGYAPYHTHTLLKKAGFRLLLAAELLGRHTYNIAGWTLLPDRPNQADFLVACEFTLRFLELSALPEVPELALQKPFAYALAMADKQARKKNGERGDRNPVRTGDCSMCLRCQTECPTAAFDADSGVSEPLKCIRCMHCVWVCPDRVLQVGAGVGRGYPQFLERWNLTEAMAQAKRSRIIAESWQATY
jgi:ferredoxin